MRAVQRLTTRAYLRNVDECVLIPEAVRHCGVKRVDYFVRAEGGHVGRALSVHSVLKLRQESCGRGTQEYV